MQPQPESSKQLPPPLEEAFLQFLNTTHPGELRQNLLGILFEYLIDRYDDLPENFNATLEDPHNLFILLDASAKHAGRWHTDET